MMDCSTGSRSWRLVEGAEQIVRARCAFAAWVWHRCSSLRPGFKVPREAAKEDAFQLLCRVRNSTLDESKAGELWDYHVGNDYYADEKAVAIYRDTINGPFLDDEYYKHKRDPEEEFLDEGTPKKSTRATIPRRAVAP